MRENIDILGVFHDGSIVNVNGALPTISLRIEIEYLRNMFPSNGNSFIARISGCELIEFYNWENETRSKNLSDIETEEPEILSIEQNGDIAHITCVSGELDISYKDIEFQLDSGEAISFKELVDASNKYWDNWESKISPNYHSN